MIIKTEEIPENVEKDSILEITSTKVNYFTHGFFKYPCKFIPQIPRWAILKYTKRGQLVLDPFAGSGTTLVEAILIGRNGLAVDFDNLSQLLCKTKTTLLSEKQIKILKKIVSTLFLAPQKKISFTPDLHNINHWFPKENIDNLLILKNNIESIFNDVKDEDIYNFLLVCFASIIKKCSYTDNTSPKPYVSSRIKKQPQAVKTAFHKAFDTYIKNVEEYLSYEVGHCRILSDDARNINAPKFEGKVDLAITSPPYINAFDYVRSLRLENSWLGYYGDSNITEIKKKQVGTETVPSKIYSNEIAKTYIAKLDEVIKKIYKKDKKRAYIVWKFFEDMRKSFKEVNKLLKKDAHYIVVVGNSKIRGFDVPTHELLIEIAEASGYKLENIFSYVIKNRYLRIPRSGRGGFIANDWVIDLQKSNG